MKFIAWLGAFVLAAIGLVTAFVKVFEGSAKEVVALTRDVVKIQAEAATQTQRFFQPPNVPVMPGMPVTPVMVQVGSELAPEETEEVTSVFMGVPLHEVGRLQLKRPGTVQAAFIVRGESGPGIYPYSQQSTISPLARGKPSSDLVQRKRHSPDTG